MKNAIIWMGKNPVVANMVMVLLLAGGYINLRHTRVEFVPDFSLDQIVIQVPYLGASPEDVEEGVCKRIEERLSGKEGILRIRSVAAEGVGVVTVELDRGADARRLLDDIKSEIDRIETFPAEIEKPVVKEVVRRSRVIDIALYGDVSERALKDVARRIRDDLRLSSIVSQVDLVGVRADEIAIEVSEESLRRFGLTFDQVQAAVARASLDVPGGSVSGPSGEILVRTQGMKYAGRDYEDIAVLARPDGTSITLGQVAHVIDGFEAGDLACRFNGKPAVMAQVFRVGEQNALDISAYIHRFVDEYRDQLPAGISIDVARDEGQPLKSRLDLVMSNAWMGLILVFVCLSLFLELHLAFWVMVGIPVAFIGSFILVPSFDASINMISMFGFIIALGIVVDDAIVVGESVFARREQVEGRHSGRGLTEGAVSAEIAQRRHKVYMRAAIDGVLDVSTPVVFSVLTTVVAFLPLLFVDGTMGKLMREIPVIVIPVLVISLAESLFILPAHLASRHGGRVSLALQRWTAWLFQGHAYVRTRVDMGLQYIITKPYARTLKQMLDNPLVALSGGLVLLLVTVGWIAGGHIKFVFLRKVDANWVTVSIAMPVGTPAEQTAAAVRKVERAAMDMAADIEYADTPGMFRNVFSFIGDQPTARSTDLFAVQGPAAGSRSHLSEVIVELSPPEDRHLTSSEVAILLRQKVGEIPGVAAMSFQASALSAGNPIEVELSSAHTGVLLEAVARLKSEVAGYPGTSDIQDSFREGKQELRLALKPQARTLGITQADMARQVRQGFYGAEGLRFQRGSDDVRVMVRYPEEERRSLKNIENMRIRTPGGGQVPLVEVADMHLSRGPATIFRSDGQRVVTVTADVDEESANAEDINRDLGRRFLPALVHDYPGLRYGFAGQQQEQAVSLAALERGYVVALIVIFGLLAIPFRSYFQPLVVMLAIPFGMIGAVWGHSLLGMELTMLSLLGIVALSGVVVNDSMLLISLYNQYRLGGMERDEALFEAGKQRFRPIILTSLTTFLGLLPMILERSVQAQFLIPMAVSLGMGLLFSTVIVLIGVPSALKVLVVVQEALGHQPFEDEGLYARSDDAAAPAQRT